MISFLFIFTLLSVILEVPADVNGCQSNLKRSKLYSYGNVCLQVSNDEKTWPKARQDCLNHGGDLVQIRDSSMQHFITGILDTNFNGYWIGAHDAASEGNWVWVTGETRMLYTNWGSGEGPAHSGGFFFGHASGEDCAQIRTDDNFKWHDYTCDEDVFHVYSYICQYNKVITFSTHAPTTQKFSTTSKPSQSTPIPFKTTAETTTEKAGMIIG